ncbi:MAG: hypothetical protein ACI97B_003960 [Verrucomicrobiales bacterium]|jgi:hypothetical protein
MFFSLLTMTVGLHASPVAHWQFDASITDDSIITDGAQNLVLNGGDSGNIVSSPDVPGSAIFDPISGLTRPNTGSVSMLGDKTTTGGSQSDNGVSRLQTTGTALQTSNESFTFETFIKVTTLSLNNGTVSIMGQFEGTGAGGFNTGWITALRPNDGTPDTFYSVDVADTNNTNDAVINAPWSVADPTDGDWHHFAQVYDHSTGDVEAFLDYQSVGSANVDTSVDAFDRNTRLLFGVRFMTNPAEGTTSTVGLLMDEARYSNSALTSNQFLQAIPEPSSLGLLLSGFATLSLLRKRGKQ